MKIGKAAVLAIAFAWVLPAQIPDFTPPTPLLGALMHNDTKQAKRLLAEGADVNDPKFLGFPPVFFPVMYQNLDLLHAMIDKGADLKAVDASGSTALMWAAFNEAGDPAMVEELLWQGLDPNAKEQLGRVGNDLGIAAGRYSSSRDPQEGRRLQSRRNSGVRAARAHSSREEQHRVCQSVSLRVMPQPDSAADGHRRRSREGSGSG